MSFDVSALYNIIGDSSRIITHNIEDRYLSDYFGRQIGTADALVFPITTEEVSSVLRFAYENYIPVTPRGAGTNLVGSTIPNGGIVLDMTKMNKILELDAETQTATVEAGVRLREFQQYVESQNFFYPPDPAMGAATLGGNASTNAGGLRAVKYGVTRNYVMGLEIVLSNGDVTVVGSKNRKDSTGLDLKDLMVGSEGTLWVITKIILRIIPKPQVSVSAIVTFADIDTAIDNVINVLGANTSPTSIEFLDRETIELSEKYISLEFPYRQAEYYLIFTFDGYPYEIRQNIDRTKEAVLSGGALNFIELDEEADANIWAIRRVVLTAIETRSEQVPVDAVVPINRLAEYISFVNNISQATGVPISIYGHAGDGNAHLAILRGNLEEDYWQQSLQYIQDVVYDEVYRLSGLVSGGHGIGLTKKPFFLRHTSPVNIYMMNQIKDALDSKHILNSGKVFMI